jgi:hypothetical protein
VGPRFNACPVHVISIELAGAGRNQRIKHVLRRARQVRLEYGVRLAAPAELEKVGFEIEFMLRRA